MAFVLAENHHNLIYVLLVVLYSMVSVNFYLTYQLNKQCNRKAEPIDQNSKLETVIELKHNLKNDYHIKSDGNDSNSESNESRVHRNKRQSNERQFDFFDSNNLNKNSMNGMVFDYNSNHESSGDHSHHSHHSHRLRHRKRVKSRSAPNQSFDDNSGPVVEFFPKPQPTQETPGYVWLTSYSRIPVQALEQYCLATQKYCPPAERGPPGPHGLKGNKGDRGPLGDKGSEGNRGPHGPKGPPGNKGEPGLDGREGLPGEPGLDGAPGRDGKNGQDGMPGLPGIPGRAGLNGTNGINGVKGERGNQGVPGMTGLPGPRGKRGPPGLNGINGIPGIQAWKHHNSTLLIPPVIGDIPDMQQTIVVKENENVRLKCTASGSPKPDITWRRDDNKAIILGTVSHTMIEGNRVNITRISRDHSGIYVCVATNGVPPSSYKKFNVEVTFPPLVKISAPNQMVGTINGSFAILECFVEAFPPPLSYWQFGDKIIEDNWKYKIFTEESGAFGLKFVLNITYIEPNDYGMYKCITKNERGKTQGVFTVFEIDPRLPKKPSEEPSYVIYGEVPLPPVETPECAPCPECNQIVQRQCKGSGRSKIASVSLSPIYNSSSWKALSKRTNHCLLSQIGKPVFYRDSESEWGCWMRDPMPIKPGDEHKYWMTTKDNKKLLNEFNSKESFRNKDISKNYSLLYRFSGNSQTIYSGSFYYSEEGTNKLVIFNLQTNESSYLSVVDATRKLTNKLLYTTQYNYMDIATDENGLWVIFPSNYTNNTMVMKFNATQVEYIWNLTIDHQTVGEMFIICGVLYGVESVSERNTKIEFAFDLYRNQQIDVSIDFTNPFSQTNFISYNPKYQKLYTWDKGNQLEYPVRFNESIDINTIDNDSDDVD